MTDKTKRISALVFLLLLTIAGLGMAIALQRNTLVDWWKPLAVCFPFACLAGRILMRGACAITNVKSRILNFAAGTILSLSIMLGGTYSLNFYKSKHSTAQTVEATVTNKYTEERRYTHRTHRHGGVRTEKRRVYIVVIKLPDERQKEFEVTPGEFTKVKLGRTFRLKIEDGMLGMPVIKNLKLPISKR